MSVSVPPSCVAAAPPLRSSPARANPHRRPGILSERGQGARPSSPRLSGKEVSVRGAESGGDAARAGADGGQSLLAAAQEGRVVGALMAAVVVVRLPALTLPLPATAKDPDERLKTNRDRNSQTNRTS